MCEQFRLLAAVPRMHEEFAAGQNVLLLDPTGQNAAAFTPQPPFVWTAPYARQFLADLQENTRQLAKDKAQNAYDLLNYQQSVLPAMDSEESAALRRFAGQSGFDAADGGAEREILLAAQRMLLVAYHNESLYLELCRVNEAFAAQQKALKSLLDENENTAQADFSPADMLTPWHRVLPAFLVFCGQADAFFVNDGVMAAELPDLAERSAEHDDCTEYAVPRAKLLRYVPERFRALCAKETYYFCIGKLENGI